MGKIIISLLVFLAASANGNPVFFANNAPAAVTAPVLVNAQTNTTTSGTVSAVSVGSGNYAVVAFLQRSSLTARSVTSVTFNGAAMSLLVSTNWLDAKGFVYIYGLASPTTGDVVVTLSGAINNRSIAVLVFSGVTTVGANLADYVTGARTSVSLSATPTLATDTVVSLLGVNLQTWTSGETLQSTAPASSSTSSETSTAPGTGSAVTMDWSGTSAAVSELSVILHGI